MKNGDLKLYMAASFQFEGLWYSEYLCKFFKYFLLN